MGYKAFLFVGLLLATVLLIASEVSARDLSETDVTTSKHTEGYGDSGGYGGNYGGGHGGHGGYGGNYGGGHGGQGGYGGGHGGGGYGGGHGGGGYGGGHGGGGYGGGHGGGGHCGYGCCRSYGHRCSRCCSYAGEAMDTAETVAKP